MGAQLVLRTTPFNMVSDPVNGSLYFAVYAERACGGNATEPGHYGIVKLSGLPTVLDLIISYQPSGNISWTTPKYPEGLPAADRYQVFTGRVADLPIFSRATLVSCDFPGGHIPSPGEYETITDPLGTPPIGQASYVIVGVESAGQRRFGRQFVDGLVSGRDPAQFPACH
jgi:hypothetical protein